MVMKTTDELAYQQLSGLARSDGIKSLNPVVGPRLLGRGQTRDAADVLGVAVLRRDLHLIKALLALQVPPDGDTDLRVSPLELAVKHATREETEVLLEYLTTRRPSEALDRALCDASYGGDVGLVRLLLDHGARAAAVCAQDESRLLAYKGSVLRCLVEAGGRLPPEIQRIADLDPSD